MVAYTKSCHWSSSCSFTMFTDLHDPGVCSLFCFFTSLCFVGFVVVELWC